MFGTDPDEAQRQLSQWAQGFADKAEQFGAMRAQVEQVQVTESSTDGAVRVTVDSSGALTDLALTDKIRDMASSEVAAQVMACTRRAQQRLAGRVREAMAATVGGEQQVIEHVVSGYRERYGEDQQDRHGPDPGILGLGMIDDDPPRYPPPAEMRRHPAPPRDEDDFSDRNYLH
ncbi:MAG TPA: YbaB/EbfC family nucleoid-associated protein [Pseudonocardiaceae bacterium]